MVTVSFSNQYDPGTSDTFTYSLDWDNNGKPVQAAGTHLDITQRKQAEKTLQEKERLLRKIAENYPNSYLSIIEKDFTVGFTSGQEFKKQHLDPKQFVGLTLEQVFGDKTAIVREYYERTFKGEECSFEMFTDDQYLHYRTWGAPLVVPIP